MPLAVNRRPSIVLTAGIQLATGQLERYPLAVNAQLRTNSNAACVTGRHGNADVAGNDPVRLAEEQAALRRVAALVARRASSADTLAAVAREVAEVIVFLASSRAAYVSGVNLSIDGAAYPCL